MRRALFNLKNNTSFLDLAIETAIADKAAFLFASYERMTILACVAI
jgi:hypothetical protein